MADARVPGDGWLCAGYRRADHHLGCNIVSGAALGVLIGGAASIALMAAVNFRIDSDFKWVLFSMALVWALSLGLFWFEKRVSGNQ